MIEYDMLVVLLDFSKPCTKSLLEFLRAFIAIFLETFINSKFLVFHS